MSKKRVCFLVHTEYHILISANQILKKYRGEEYDIRMIIKRSKRSTKLDQTMDLTCLPVQVEFWDSPSYDTLLSSHQKDRIEELIDSNLAEFIFFQEQDPFAVILANKLPEKGTKIYLYQDGLKPYVKIRFHSLSLMLGHIKQWRWIRSNGYKAEPFLSFIRSKNYAFLKSIDKVFLTFPERYVNWNGKAVEKIDLEITPGFKEVLMKLFCWKDTYLTDRDNVVFYMNQPMHDDGQFETELLNSILSRFPMQKFYIKIHPLTPKSKLDLYKTQIPGVSIVESSIPAEVFISMLKDSAIISVCSTSMFIDNPQCSFFWLNRIAESSIPRLKRYKVQNPTSHIKSVTSLSQIALN
jgi:hypothetical protein